MARKRDTAVIEAEGGASSLPPAPEGSADRVADPHEGEDITRPERGSIIPLGHAFCEPRAVAVDWVASARDACADCGFNREDHNPLFGQPNAEPGDMTVTDYDAKGEAIDREVGTKPTAQPTLPGVPSEGIWGDYQGHRLSHVQLAFGGGPDAPRDLAGKLKIGDRIHLLVTGHVANNGYQQDKDLIYFGKVRVKLDAVTVPGKRFVEEAMVVPEPPELIRRSLVEPFVIEAAAFLDGREPSMADCLALLADLASLFDPLPFEEDGETDVDEATGSADDTSPLSAALAEAMAEA